MKKISNHITYKEAVHSNTALRLNIKNIPNNKEVSNMVIIATQIFEPLREYAEGPIKINSMFRSKDLNRAIGGSISSQHCKGQAIDLDDTFGCKTNAEMFSYIKTNLNFDQLIWEFGDSTNPNWIHVSYVSDDLNRNKILIAEKINGRTSYRSYEQETL
tara:strand:+ start:317 stop:793 length:477 start_codon:yes stop_codon:yes gene_type:complete